LTQSNVNLSQIPFWRARGYCVLRWDFKVSCQHRRCWQRLQYHTDVSESQMAHVKTEPLDILWSSRDGPVSIELMLQAQWRWNEVRLQERFLSWKWFSSGLASRSRLSPLPLPADSLPLQRLRSNSNGRQPSPSYACALPPLLPRVGCLASKV
jgi:hypothetical protein